MSASGLLELVSARRGHFLLESGYHGGLWLDLDPLFADARRVEPFVADLTGRIRPYEATAVCGPLVGGAFLAQLIARALGAEFWFTERVNSSNTERLYSARYSLPSAIATRAAGHRVAIVDDVMSAGSSLRATYDELRSHGAVIEAAGALVQLGDRGAKYFGERHVPVVRVEHHQYQLWTPADCTLCLEGHPLEDPHAVSGQPAT